MATWSTKMQAKCNGCGYIGYASEFRKSLDFFRRQFICGCPKCDNHQDSGYASMRMLFGGDGPFEHAMEKMDAGDYMMIKKTGLLGDLRHSTFTTKLASSRTEMGGKELDMSVSFDVDAGHETVTYTVVINSVIVHVSNDLLLAVEEYNDNAR